MLAFYRRLGEELDQAWSDACFDSCPLAARIQRKVRFTQGGKRIEFLLIQGV